MAKSKAAKNREEMQAELKAFLGTTAGSVLVAVTAGVALLPYGIQYLVKATEDQGLPYVAMLGSTIGNAIEEHAKATAKKVKEAEAKKWHEVNPDITTATVDFELPGTTLEKVVWIENMRLPPSADLLKKPADIDHLKVFKNSGNWSYYGVYTLNKNQYWLLVPKHIELYRIATYKKYTAERQPDFCEQNYENWREYPACYDIIESKELVWPTRWPV